MKRKKRDECTTIDDVVKRNIGEFKENYPETDIVNFRSQFGGKKPTPEQFIAAVTSSVRAAM